MLGDGLRFQSGLGEQEERSGQKDAGAWGLGGGVGWEAAAGMWLEHDPVGLTLEKSRGWGLHVPGGCWGWRKGAAWAREQRGGHGWGPPAARGGQNLEMVFVAGGVRCWRCLGLSWEHHN